MDIIAFQFARAGETAAPSPRHARALDTLGDRLSGQARRLHAWAGHRGKACRGFRRRGVGGGAGRGESL